MIRGLASALPSCLGGDVMALCAVNFPAMSSEDYLWIQSIRQEHDALFFNVVEPHFALVFPTDQLGESELIAHVAAITARTEPFDAVLRCAILGDPSFMEHAHVFLIPDEGFSDIVRLHDALYTGPLQSELRLNLPFVPHIGVASSPNIDQCKRIVDRINGERIAIHARVEKLSIIGYDGKRVWGITECLLAGCEA
jgi:2'-5' RNA ligase